MTQEEKQQLIIELCSRLPYGVMVRTAASIKTLTCEILSMIIDGKNTFTIFPYLRPMSSMTEEERKFYYGIVHIQRFEGNYEIDAPSDNPITTIEISRIPEVIDWFNAHHFDYRGSIGKGIALDAKDMYNNKTEK